MKLREALLRSNRQELAQLALANDFGGKVKGADALAAWLTAPERVRRAVAGLDKVEAAALRVVWVGYGGQADWRAPRVLEKRLGLRHRGQAAFETLVARALLLPPSAVGGRYLVPDEIRPTLAGIASDWLLSAMAGPKTTPEFPPTPEAATFLGDFTRLLGRLKTGVSIAGGHHVYKREQLQLLRWFAPLPCPPPLALPATSGLWSDFDPRLALPLALAASLDLVRQVSENPTRWASSPLAADWVELDPWTQWWGLFQAWMHLLEEVNPVLPQCVLIASREGSALPQRAAEWVWSSQPSPDHRLVNGSAVAFLLHTGWLMGALNVAPGAASQDPGPVASCTPAARAALRRTGPPADWPAWEERFFVQADFEVIAPPFLHPRCLRRLAAICEPGRIDRATVLRLAQGPVLQAQRAGEDIAGMEAFLASGATGGLPQNVAFTLREWRGHNGQLALERAVVVRLDNPEVARHLQALAAVRAFVREEVTPNLWLVDADAAPRLWRVLTDHGCEPRGDLADLLPPAERLKYASSRLEQTADLPWPGPSYYTQRFPLPSDTDASEHSRQAGPESREAGATEAAATREDAGQTAAAAPVTIKRAATPEDGRTPG